VIDYASSFVLNEKAINQISGFTLPAEIQTQPEPEKEQTEFE